MVNQLALASLPKSFPEFVKTPLSRERIAFLSGEPDRWRNSADLTLKHYNGPDHFLDIDLLPPLGIAPEKLTQFRHDFTVQLARAQAAHPDQVEKIDPAKDADHTKSLVGYLPWTIAEYYSKLRSGFSYLRTFEEEGGTPEEIANARDNIIYIMGVMGHFVGDGSQPLHTTKHYNGWVGPNPHNYPTNRTFHQWIDGGFIQRANIKTDEMIDKVRPAVALPQTTNGNVFGAVMTWLLEQHKLVEPIYKLEKENKLSGRNPSAEGREFITGQLIEAGQMLGSLWLTAWESAPVDTYLKRELTRRKNSSQ